MNKEQEEFMRRNQKLDKICEETQGYGRMQIIDRIADLEIDKDKLIRYLEDRIIQLKYHKAKSYSNKLRRQECKLLLERVKSNKYE